MKTIVEKISELNEGKMDRKKLERIVSVKKVAEDDYTIFLNGIPVVEGCRKDEVGFYEKEVLVGRRDFTYYLQMKAIVNNLKGGQNE